MSASDRTPAAARALLDSKTFFEVRAGIPSLRMEIDREDEWALKALSAERRRRSLAAEKAADTRRASAARARQLAEREQQLRELAYRCANPITQGPSHADLLAELQAKVDAMVALGAEVHVR